MNVLLLMVMLSAPCPDGPCSSYRLQKAPDFMKVPPVELNDQYLPTEIVGVASALVGLTIMSVSYMVSKNSYVPMIGLAFALQGSAIFGVARYKHYNTYVVRRE